MIELCCFILQPGKARVFRAQASVKSQVRTFEQPYPYLTEPHLDQGSSAASLLICLSKLCVGVRLPVASGFMLYANCSALGKGPLLSNRCAERRAGGEHLQSQSQVAGRISGSLPVESGAAARADATGPENDDAGWLTWPFPSSVLCACHHSFS
jgi:hypothetical protein